MTDQEDDEKIDYHGIKISRGWLQQIEEAQEIDEVIINGRPYTRLRYGNEQEDWGTNDNPCGDCGVVRGQFHVPNCDIERCPACGGQAIGCNCDYEGDDEEEE